MSNLAMWSGIVAFFVPVIVALLSQQKWPSYYKAVLFFGVSLIAAAGTSYWQGDFTGKRWLDSALIVVSAGGAFYYAWWKPTVAPAIERATSLGK